MKIKGKYNFAEKLSWNETRTAIRSPDSYNFGINRNMNIDYKITNNLVTKYSWASQSKLNDFRGYAWTAIKNLDPGVITNITESMNTTYNPQFLPLGPRVTLTEFARASTPRFKPSLASISNFISFAILLFF